MKIAAVIPAGPGREPNLRRVLKSLEKQTRRHDLIVVVEDGFVWSFDCEVETVVCSVPRHEPGMEQPRNIGVRTALTYDPDIDFVHFVDTDVILAPTAVEALATTIADSTDEPGVVICPYDWMPLGVDEPMLDLRNDPRWAMFNERSHEGTIYSDLSVGLGCFSGNLLWSTEEFERVGGFWNELHHGRCEDGELGLRAVAMDVGIAMCPEARGWHMAHDINGQLIERRNERDVPMLNDRHPWVERGGVFLVDRDGAAFDVRCGYCNETVPTGGWWEHAAQQGHGSELVVSV